MYNVENIFNTDSQKLHQKTLKRRKEKKKAFFDLIFLYSLKK